MMMFAEWMLILGLFGAAAITTAKIYNLLALIRKTQIYGVLASALLFGALFFLWGMGLAAVGSLAPNVLPIHTFVFSVITILFWLGLFFTGLEGVGYLVLYTAESAEAFRRSIK